MRDDANCKILNKLQQYVYAGLRSSYQESRWRMDDNPVIWTASLSVKAAARVTGISGVVSKCQTRDK